MVTLRSETLLYMSTPHRCMVSQMIMGHWLIYLLKPLHSLICQLAYSVTSKLMGRSFNFERVNFMQFQPIVQTERTWSNQRIVGSHGNICSKN